MLRKKNITLNGQRAKGSELLTKGDRIQIYFSDETYAKLSAAEEKREALYDRLRTVDEPLDVLYEDAALLVLNKPAGLLTQQQAAGDISLNERMLAYLIRSGSLSREAFGQFKPSVVNRLDRNTSGIVLAAKTYAAARSLSEAIARHTIRKVYHCIVVGACTLEGAVVSYVEKDGAANLVTVRDAAWDGAARIETRYRPLEGNGALTRMEAELVTGKSHQIRAQLAFLGYPILFDPKYGDRAANVRGRKWDTGRGQLLHAYRVTLPDGRVFTAEEPAVFGEVLREA